MDPKAGVEPNEQFNHQTGGSPASIGEKRPVENGEEGELAVKLNKKARCGPGVMKRVAEIVLVLSAMARMRGGRKPTEAELGLMAEARAKLVEMCQELAPKDIVAREAIGAVIEDLGLNSKVKDQRLGYRGPRLSIAEKVSLTKRKEVEPFSDKSSKTKAKQMEIEESKKFIAQSATHTSNSVQGSIGAAAESRGISHIVRMFPADKTSHASMSSVGIPTSSPQSHASTAASTSMSYQLPNSELRASTVSSGLPTSHLGRDSSPVALPRVERTHIKVDGGSNGPLYTTQMQSNSSTNHPLVNAPTWSVQPQSASSGQIGPEIKLSNNNSGKIEGAPDFGTPRMASPAARDQTFRPFITQTASGNFPVIHQPLQGMNIVQAPSFGNSHHDIVKIVQRLLQPHLPEHPMWTPPSREYMNKTLTCQMCKLTLNEVDTVLLCDACEKGHHLKCLQANNQKGIPRAEWHCMRCVALSNGKPLPPKYGRVMRSFTTTKAPSIAAGVQSFSEKKVGTPDSKVNQQKLTVSGGFGLQSSVSAGTIFSSCIESTSDLKIPNTVEIQGSNFSSSAKDKDQGSSSGICPNYLTNSFEAVSGSPSVFTSGERCTQLAQISEATVSKERLGSGLNTQSPAGLSETVGQKSDCSQTLNNSQDVQTDLNSAEIASKNSDETNYHENNAKVEDSGKSCIEGDNDKILRVDKNQQNDEQANTVGISGPSPKSKKNAGFSLDGMHKIEWISDVSEVVDGKKFYQSCTVDGIAYKLHDHVLFRSGHDRLIPSKLKALWEDIRTGSKWVVINKCYFPGDLPDAVVRPGAPESNEVYESSKDCTVMAGLIEGPCDVLPAAKFKEECNRRSQLGTEGNQVIRPVFLCNWSYDEFKGIFQTVSN